MILTIRRRLSVGAWFSLGTTINVKSLSSKMTTLWKILYFFYIILRRWIWCCRTLAVRVCEALLACSCAFRCKSSTVSAASSSSSSSSSSYSFSSVSSASSTSSSASSASSAAASGSFSASFSDSVGSALHLPFGEGGVERGGGSSGGEGD